MGETGFYVDSDKMGENTITLTWYKPFTSINEMFYYGYSVISVDFTNFNFSSVEYMESAFRECQKLKSVDISNFNNTNIKGNIDGIFLGCKNLEYINLTNYKGTDIFISIPAENNLTICFNGDELSLPESLRLRNVTNICYPPVNNNTSDKKIYKLLVPIISIIIVILALLIAVLKLL